MCSLEQKKQEIIDNFSMFEDWMEKYEYLIDLGKQLDNFPESSKTQQNIIDGCQSRVWLDYFVKEDKIYLIADSDAIITKGIISLLIAVYSGKKPLEIYEDDFSFIEKIGLRENLSPTRANGLASMIEKIKEIAKNNL